MSSEETVHPIIKKDALKEALSELLNEMPVLRAWTKGAKLLEGKEVEWSEVGPLSRPLPGPPLEPHGPHVAGAGV